MLYHRFELLPHEVLLGLEHLALHVEAVVFHLVDLLVSLLEVVQELLENLLRHFLLDAFDLGSCLQGQRVDVLVEETSPLGPIGEDHDADPLLNSLDPVTPEPAEIGPLHRSVALTLVVMIVSRVFVSRLPLEDSEAVLSVHLVVPLVLVAPTLRAAI